MKTRPTQEDKVTPQGTSPDDLTVRVVRSPRRRKTADARLLNWHTLEIRVPAHLTQAQVERITQEMVERVRQKRRRMRHYAR